MKNLIKNSACVYILLSLLVVLCVASALFYKSPAGIYAYEGSVPRCVSQALGE